MSYHIGLPEWTPRTGLTSLGVKMAATVTVRWPVAAGAQTTVVLSWAEPGSAPPI